MEPEPTIEVNIVALRLPPFWDKTPELWFANIEAQFAISCITKDCTKYYVVVSALNSDILNYVSDIVLNPPAKNHYNTLKTQLLANFSDLKQRQIKALFSDITLGDEKSSHLLRKRKQLANNKLGKIPKNLMATATATTDSGDPGSLQRRLRKLSYHG
ncbi:uncharacterized protein LOC111624186 [Centruroides sculpturatus]|uniref:uncharacterized protein LOC111624186 n=1 Tax=Centruroides sculpturatus TaxID=218467 RepID=UPI000C6CF2E0|nr:uncharacterized protein LOC111624186 [Centruroides sculpturatus]